MTSVSHQLTEHFFRHSYAKMVAVLVRYFGLSEVEVAEDIAQDTLVTAMEAWSVGSIPDNPRGWLMDVAKKKTISYLRRNKVFNDKIRANLTTKLLDETSELKENDDTLRMIFTCCHPSLPPESQISLSLKTLCGLSISEIANALLTTESNVNKRLYRAKKKFRDGLIAFDLPVTGNVDQRLNSVFTTLYLLFNEGYYSTHHEKVIRMDLCFEAIRLAEEIAKYYPGSYQAKALLALMYLSTARFESRLDEHGALVILTEQDRDKWDKDLIAIGMQYLHESMKNQALSVYHLQAGISAEHCLAEDFASTNWPSIFQQYTTLERIQPNILFTFNKTIAKFYGINKQEALVDMLALSGEKALQNNSQYYATLGSFYADLGLKSRAFPYFKKALDTSKSKEEKALIERKMAG